MSWKVLLKDSFLNNIGLNFYHRKSETDPGTSFVNEKFSILVACYIS